MRARSPYRQVLSHGTFRRLLFGQIVSLFGDFLALFAVLDWLAFRQHAGPAAITMLTFWALLPLAIFSPLAGALVDRWNVKWTMIGSDAGRAGLIALLLTVHQISAIYIIFAVMGVLSSAFQPARSVMVKLLVPDEELIAANGLLQQSVLLTRVLAMPAAGLLVAAFGSRLCFWADIASFAVSAATVYSIAVPSPVARARKQAGLLAELGEGLRFLAERPRLAWTVGALGIALFTSTSMTPLLAVYVRDRLAAGSLFFGLLSGLVGAGAVVGIQMLPRLRGGRDDSQMVFRGLAVLAGSALLLALIRTAIPVGAGAFGIGFGIALVLTPAQTLLQIQTPLPMLGRVSSTVLAVISTAQLGGVALSGRWAEAAGVRSVFLGCAALTGVCALFPRFSRASWSGGSPAAESVRLAEVQRSEQPG